MFLLLFLSMDSFIVSLGLGLLRLSPQRRYQTCFLFGVCDGFGTLVGLHLKWGQAILSPRPWIAGVGISAWISFVAFLTYQIAIKRPASRYVIPLLAVVLATDNLLAGPISSVVWSFPANLMPIATTLFSAGLALAGLAIGGLVEEQISRPLAIGLGAVLLCLTPILL
jgi:putative Mn2+ efflux pump MntP